MFKIMAFLSKREDIETRAFIDYYEHHHVPLIRSLAPTPIGYKRNYLVRGDELNIEDDSIDFDVVTELRLPRSRRLSRVGCAALAIDGRRADHLGRRAEVPRPPANPGLRRRGMRDVCVSRATALTPGTSSSAMGEGDDSLRTVANTAAITSAAPIRAETPRLSSRITAPSSTATAGLTYWWLTTVEIGRCCSAQT